MQQIGSTTVKRTTAKGRYIYPYIPLPPQYASLVGSHVDNWQNIAIPPTIVETINYLLCN